MKIILHILPILITIMFLSCKDDDGIDASNIKNSCYEEYVYRNYPDLQTDTVTYYFKDDTITATGYIYKSVDNINIPIKKDTQNYYYQANGSLLSVKNMDLSNTSELVETPNYVGITRHSKWRITNLTKEKVEIDFLDNNNKLSGQTILWGK